MSEANRSFLDKKENVEHTLANPSNDGSVINLKGFELAGLSVGSSVTLDSATFTFDVSADNGANYQTLQTPDSAGTLSDFSIDAPSSGKAVALPLDVFAAWKHIKIIPSDTNDYGKVINLALRSY